MSSDCQGNVLGMVQDIADCLVWAQESGPKFNFDKVRNIFQHPLETELLVTSLTIYYKLSVQFKSSSLKIT